MGAIHHPEKLQGNSYSCLIRSSLSWISEYQQRSDVKLLLFSIWGISFAEDFLGQEPVLLQHPLKSQAPSGLVEITPEFAGIVRLVVFPCLNRSSAPDGTDTKVHPPSAYQNNKIHL